MPDPDDVITKASLEKNAIQDNIREVANWFHDQEGELIEKSEAVDRIDKELNIEATHDGIASDIVSSLASDHVDPVQHISNSDGQFVGVIDYDEHDGYYSFTEYHDIVGEHIRAVCGACIGSSTRSSEPFTRHTGEFGNEPYEDEDELHKILSNHVNQEHDNVKEVKTGATLASGTTIAGNTSFHAGNDGPASGLSADDVDGSEPPFVNSDLNNSSVSFAGVSAALGDSVNLGLSDLDDYFLVDDLNTQGNAIKGPGQFNPTVRFRADGTSTIINDEGGNQAIRLEQLSGYKITANTGTPVQLRGSGGSIGVQVDENANVTVNSQEVVTSATDYEIQKDGTDGAGIINFKTV